MILPTPAPAPRTLGGGEDHGRTSDNGTLGQLPRLIVPIVSHDLLVVRPEDGRGFRIDTHGQRIRQGFSARFAQARVEKSAKDLMREWERERIARAMNSDEDPVGPGEAKWFVGTMGAPGDERVISVAREEWFSEGRNPTADSIEVALTAKYGTPTRREERDGKRTLTWAYDPLGRRVTETSPLFTRCRMNADPDSGYQLSPDCGGVAAAVVTPRPDDPGLSRFLQVAVAHQAGGYESIATTERRLEELAAERRAKQVEQATKDADAPAL
ncbi:MAG: hypothetical protein KIT14_16180 [bacterium]|nr:hypothetical protein [bacterium]